MNFQDGDLFVRSSLLLILPDSADQAGAGKKLTTSHFEYKSKSNMLEILTPQ